MGQGREDSVITPTQSREEEVDTTQGREEAASTPQGRDEVPDTTQGREDKEDTTQRREGVSPAIVEITDENKHRLSEINPGMILNEDGTFTMTPQSMTLSTNKEMQLLREYHFIPAESEDVSDILNHPKPTKMRLKWSYVGEWVLVPRCSNHEEEQNFKNSRVARVEKFIDSKGVIRRGISYGDDDSKLIVWYRLEDLQEALPRWKIAQPTIFYNGKKFSREYKRQDGEKSKAKPRGRQQYSDPRDQSSDIQGNEYVRGGRGGRAGGGNHGYTRGRRGYIQRGSGIAVEEAVVAGSRGRH